MTIVQRVARAFSFLVIFLVPITVLTGWSIGNIYLTRINPSFTPMNPVSASCFIVVGILLLIQRYVRVRTRFLVTLPFALILIVVGAAMSIKYLFGIDIYIDRIFFTASLGINRMAPAVGAAFLLLGLSYICARPVLWLARLFRVIVVGISVYAISAYLYNFVGVYGKAIYNPVAIHTATLLLVASLYLLLDEGQSGVFGRRQWRYLIDWFENLRIAQKFMYGFGVVIAIVVIFSIYAVLSIQAINRVELDQTRSLSALKAADQLDIDALNSQLDFAKYLSAPNTVSVNTLTANRTLLAQRRAVVRQQTQSPKVIELLNSYEADVPERVSIANQIIADITAGDTPDTYQDLVARRTVLLNLSRGYLEQIVAIENTDFTTQFDQFQNQIQVIRVNLVFFAIVMLLLILLLSFVIARSFYVPVEKLQRQAKRLAAGDLTARTEVKTNDEIGILAQTINSMASVLAVRTKELQQSKAQDDAILASIGDAVFAVDTQGKLILMNPVAASFIGVKTGEVLGKQYTDYLQFVLEKTGEVTNEFVEEALSGKKAKMANDTMLRMPNGTLLPVADSASPLIDSSGNTTGAVIVFRDVTHDRQVDRAKTEFVSLASHQLRTPLTSIKWYAELLLDSDNALAEEQEEYAHQIQNAANRMNTLVGALLDISRLDLGTFVIEPTEENLLEIMQTAVDEQKLSIEKRKQQLTFDHPDSVHAALFDRKLAFIIVQNLISNANKYTPEGGTLSLSLSVGQGGSFVITCTDNGLGIPETQQSSIFKKLFRADNVRALDVEGTGLGLYMIKTIVDSAGGTIAFTSKENVGTTFTVTFPASGMRAKKGTKTLGT